MAKLHELLAAEGSAKAQAEKCRTDLLHTFEKKRHLFAEKIVTFTPSGEGAQAVTEAQSDLQSTVGGELRWIEGIWAAALDVAYQVAESNMGARADVALDDGTVLLKDVPALALLELEKRATELHTLVSQIPTLDPALGFAPDPARGAGIYKAREVRKSRTKKTPRAFTKAPATPEHPEQAEIIWEDVPIGTLTEQEWSALLTPAAKSEMLARAENLRRALKTARSRANEAPAAATKIGKTLLSYVFGS